MNEADIANALGQRLAAAPSLGTIVFENKDATPAKPYLQLEIVRVNRRDATIVGTDPISLGFAQVTIVAEVDKFSTSAVRLADDVAARFPMGLRLNVSGGGVIVIIQPPSVLQGFRDGPDWRVPVRIEYEAAA
jgi:hypothetical protein